MSKIPADVDELMWTIAESNNSQSIREFGSRFPELRPELLKRIKVLAEFKGAKSKVSLAEPSHFHRTKLKANAKGISWRLAAATGALTVLVIAGLAMAALNLNHAPSNKEVASAIQNPGHPSPETNQQANVSPNVVYRSKLPQASPTPSQPQPSSVPNDSSHLSQPLLLPSGAVGPEGTEYQVSARHKPITVDIQNAKLSDALALLAAQAKLRIQVAPGLKDQMVSLSYQQESPRDILKDLGAKYGFTPFYQGKGLYIIIPARANPSHGRATHTSNSGSNFQKEPASLPTIGQNGTNGGN